MGLRLTQKDDYKRFSYFDNCKTHEKNEHVYKLQTGWIKSISELVDLSLDFGQEELSHVPYEWRWECLQLSADSSKYSPN